VTAGKPASYINDLGVIPFFGYSAAVNLTCAVPAPGTTCTVDPPVTNISAGGFGVATVTVATTSRIAAELGPQISHPFSAYPALLASLSLIVLALLMQMARRKQIGLAMLAGSALVLSLLLSGCGGGGSSGPSTPAPPTPNPNGTPAGTYTVTIKGTAGATTHTTTVTLIVQ
jgi:hypothetical protein